MTYTARRHRAESVQQAKDVGVEGEEDPETFKTRCLERQRMHV